MKVIKSDGQRKKYIFEDLSECDYADKNKYAELSGKVYMAHEVKLADMQVVQPSLQEYKSSLKPRIFKTNKNKRPRGCGDN